MDPQFPGFDPTRPNEARMLDYMLGGKDNFAADREAVDRAVEMAPDLPFLAREARRFLRRVVRHLVGAGVRQIIDVGCGLPTQGYVHEIAHEQAPDTRVAYVDNDPVVVTHANALLDGNDHTAVVQADMRDPGSVLAHPELKRAIDLAEPVAVLLNGVLVMIPEDEVCRRIVDGFRDGVAPGSHLALSHPISDQVSDLTGRLADFYQDQEIVRGERRANVRTRAEVEPFFDGLELVPPGIVNLPLWHPELNTPGELEEAVDPASVWSVGGVGRKP